MPPKAPRANRESPHRTRRTSAFATQSEHWRPPQLCYRDRRIPLSGGGRWPTFILIHGARHGGWCRERIAPLPAAKGHRVLAPDLPGMEREPQALGDDPLGEWADFVAGLASRAERPVILVGHSRGGAVISEVAERVPEGIDRLVYLTAFLLEDGQSPADVANRHPDVGPGTLIRPAEDPSTARLGR